MHFCADARVVFTIFFNIRTKRKVKKIAYSFNDGAWQLVSQDRKILAPKMDEKKHRMRRRVFMSGIQFSCDVLIHVKIPNRTSIQHESLQYAHKIHHR